MAMMTAPESGVTVRMYRQGHGDCFLLAFAPKDGGERPVFMMIDCGNKPGSEIELDGEKVTADDVVADIRDACGGRLDIVVVTHEHQDHVNLLGKFRDFEIGEAWFAWTEDPADDLANELRRRHNDQLRGLLGARHAMAERLGAGADAKLFEQLDELLSLELDGEETEATAAIIDRALADMADASTPLGFGAGDEVFGISNKNAMKVIRDRAENGLHFFSPHESPREVPGSAGALAFPLGPPRREDLLEDEDPVGDEQFGHLVGSGLSFFSATRGSEAKSDPKMPFAPSTARRLDALPTPSAKKVDAADSFFLERYGQPDDDAPDAWRRIDTEWLFAAEEFALKLNEGVNNTSLVLAFELPTTKKVLLFVGDAQRGNWISWDDDKFEFDGRTATCKELLSRTVLYKVGHHGSHNATLTGDANTDEPGLAWMAEGAFAEEFIAMIPANREWAMGKSRPWNHPLPAIKHALFQKARGRIFQTDEGLPTRPSFVTDAEWTRFETDCAVKGSETFLEVTISDEA